MKQIRHLLSRIAVLATVLVTVMLTSCGNTIYEDLQECRSGARLRFVYDYNMEFANAFPAQVECLTLHIYDGLGLHQRTVTAHRPQLADENWRMMLDLEPGKYIMYAYGGMDCEEASFSFNTEEATRAMETLRTNLKETHLSSPVGKPLHHLYYGKLEMEIPEPTAGSEYTDATLYMMKDTNDLRIMLAYADGREVDANEFDITFTTDNTVLDYRNDIVPSGEKVYYPWVTGAAAPGTTDGTRAAVPYQVAYAEISTSRLVHGNNAVLNIVRRSDRRNVVSIPLINVLLLLKSDRYESMENQEFLDRESRWNLTFFLTGDAYWGGTSIVINDWIVRINNIDTI